MPKYRIPVVFTMWGIMEIEASTLEDAEKIALDTEPLPATKYYVEGSLKLDKEAAGYGETGMTKQPVSYTHLDVYKRQICNYVRYFKQDRCTY